jgi:membrane protein DedA with SNARE-associated domain
MDTFGYWLAHYGYFGVFSLLMLGIIGLPVPEETLLISAGVLIYRGHLQVVPTLVAAVTGSCCGITVSYGLGRAFGGVVTRKLGRVLHLESENVERVHRWFERVGHWALLGGYFFPGIRHLTALVAGATRLSYADFSLFAYAGALGWSVTFISLGAVAGRQWARYSVQVHHWLLVASACLVALLMIGFALRRIAARHR